MKFSLTVCVCACLRACMCVCVFIRCWSPSRRRLLISQSKLRSSTASSVHLTSRCVPDLPSLKPTPPSPLTETSTPQALLWCHDSVAQVDYGPVLPEQQAWDGQQALRLVCLEKREEPLVRQRPLYLTGATGAGSGCVVLSSIESRDATGRGGGAARHRWNSLLRAGGAWSGEQLGEATPLPLPRRGRGAEAEGLGQQPFLLHRQVVADSCLRPGGGQLCRRGLHQSAPSVCNPALCNGKKRRRRRRNQTLNSDLSLFIRPFERGPSSHQFDVTICHLVITV